MKQTKYKAKADKTTSCNNMASQFVSCLSTFNIKRPGFGFLKAMQDLEHPNW